MVLFPSPEKSQEIQIVGAKKTFQGPILHITLFSKAQMGANALFKSYGLYNLRVKNLGWALWNRNSFEFKFDDTRLSSYYKNKISPINLFLLRPDSANSGCNKKKFQSGQSYLYIMSKVWYHQIWIQNYFSFIVSDLIYIPHNAFWLHLSIGYCLYFELCFF